MNIKCGIMEVVACMVIVEDVLRSKGGEKKEGARLQMLKYEWWHEKSIGIVEE